MENEKIFKNWLLYILDLFSYVARLMLVSISCVDKTRLPMAQNFF